MWKAQTRDRAMPNPGLVWQPGRVPFAGRFGDVYHSREDGLAEARHVFLTGCGLPEGWRDADVFVIGELGFGTGRNFLATWDLWRRTKRHGARLHYLAVEGFPLTPREVAECLEAWPELHALADALVNVYPQPQPGFHRLFPKIGGASDDVVLTLLMGDAAEMLTQLECSVDAWFLDGFAPDKNPAMWSPVVFAEMARLSHDRNGGSVLATHSEVDGVRQDLDTAGFGVARVPGHGSKREMLHGRFRGRGVPPKPRLQPWFAKAPAARIRQGHAAIIGGGIAGANVAFALRRRGWQTTIVDRRDALARETSGNPTGALMPRLTAGPALDGRFYAAAWRFGLNVLEELADTGAPLHRERCGLLQLANTPAEAERQMAIATAGPLAEPALFQATAREASDIAGVALSQSALYFPHGGWLEPPALCTALAQDAATLLNADIASLRYENGVWLLLCRDGQVRARADIVVLANALGALSVPQAAWLPLVARRGQLTFAPPTDRSAALRSVLAYGGYMTPAFRGFHSIGATFDWVDADGAETATDIRAADHAHNLAALENVLPGLMAGISPHTLSGRAGVRCTSPDHLPLVGALPQRDAYLRDFAELRHGHPWTSYADADYQPGLYTLLGLGSHGLVAAPLAAEILACHITGEPWPLERDLITALHAGRFLVRDLKRGDV